MRRGGRQRIQRLRCDVIRARGPVLTIEKGDITRVSVDVIVNAANPYLAGGGGVDGAIHAAGGPKILEECQTLITEIGVCTPGSAVATSAGNLPASWVIHTVGPIWSNAEQSLHDDTLASCYRTSLDLAAQLNAGSIAFPNISTGIYGFPKDRAARIATTATLEWIAEHPGTTALESVRFVCFDGQNFDLCQNALAAISHT